MTAPNMLMEPGNLANSFGHIVGARSGLITAVAAGGVVFALRNVLQATGRSKPIAISQIRTRFVTTTAFGTGQGLAFEYHKVTGFSSQYSGGSPVAVAVTRRKTQPQDAIPSSQVSAVVAATAAITTATHSTIDDQEPVEVAAGGGGVAFGFGSRWVPVDGYPLVLEGDEGLVCRVVNTMGATGAGHLFVGVDFFRY